MQKVIQGICSSGQKLFIPFESPKKSEKNRIGNKSLFLNKYKMFNSIFIEIGAYNQLEWNGGEDSKQNSKKKDAEEITYKYICVCVVEGESTIESNIIYTWTTVSYRTMRIILQSLEVDTSREI